MQKKLLIGMVVLGLSAVLISPAYAQEKTQKPPQQHIDPNRMGAGKGPGKSLRPPTGPSFYIAPIEETPTMFSVLLSDGAGNSVAGTFTRQQIDVFEAVLDSANVFALTDEKVGSNTPVTTRFMEQHEWSLFVDVSKIGDKSRFYVSLITPQGRLTAAAGEITRGSKKEQSALLLDILTQVRKAQGGGKPLQ